MKAVLTILGVTIGIFFQVQAFQFEQLIKPKKMKSVEIKQFEDDGLAHFSYAVSVGDKMILVDPGRDPQPYYDYAKAKNARIIGVIETHPHADFVSSHLEIHRELGVTIYASKLAEATYPHKTFDEGDEIWLSGDVRLIALFTPGHSPDGISVLVEEAGEAVAVFTGDTLFIGDVGRPDLRESSGNVMTKREELARMMYKSTREKLMVLDDGVLVFPAHGAGSLCGKSMSKEKSSTIGAEKLSNYALQPMTEDEFVALLLEDQPFIPKYFPFNVDVNKTGAAGYRTSLDKVRHLEKNFKPENGAVIVDGRQQEDFKSSHIDGAINIMDGAKFETWLGSILAPRRPYYLVAESETALNGLIAKAAKIGYETFIEGAFVYDNQDGESMDTFDKADFDENRNSFTILDIRNESEVANGKYFEDAVHIPLPELMERVSELPQDKPIVVHCGSGYRSAIGSSIVKNALGKTKVLDMGSHIQSYEDK